MVTPTLASARPLQCVPFAREVSGVELRGNAYTWWNQAEGRYSRGHEPRVGAVMAMPSFGAMRNGHVATVAKVLNDREVLLDHANWSRPGMIERGVRAIDVSEDNDWSKVRVWFAPIQGIGGSVIYLVDRYGDRSIYDGLAALKKDNRGYDVTQLLAGAEGTLGIVTRAVLRLRR